MAMDQFILFGDSITQWSFSQERGFGAGAALSDVYARKLDVVNRGFSGYNTTRALQVLPKVMPTPRDANVRFMAFFLGSNDARSPGLPPNPQQHTPIEEYKENLRALVNHRKVIAHQGIRRILVTPPPVDDRKCDQNDFTGENWSFLRKPGDAPHRKAKVYAQYAQAVREVGQELNLPVLDLWGAMVGRAGGSATDAEPVGSSEKPLNETLRSFVLDGLHLSPEGYKVFYDELMALIARTWPDQMPDKLPFVLPEWKDEKAWESYALL